MADAPTVGIIGLGIGRVHIRGFQANGCKVVAVCQRDEKGAQAIADKYGIPQVFGRWQDLIAKAKPQIVVVASPPNLHRDTVLAAFESGAHVLCEKPLALTARACTEMIGAAEAADRLLGVGLMRRFFPSVQAIASIVHNHVLGAPLSFAFARSWIDQLQRRCG